MPDEPGLYDTLAELDVGPPDAPDVHPRPMRLAKGLSEPLPACVRWLLVGLALTAALITATYSPSPFTIAAPPREAAPR